MFYNFFVRNINGRQYCAQGCIGIKMQKTVTKIMVFGTFDILHPGHVHFFKQARRLSKNSFLIVSIARDASVEKVKGRLPVYSENARADFVRNTSLANRVVLGSLGNHVEHILEEAPDIIALGYDQVGHYVDSTVKHFEENNIPIRIVRLKPHRPEKYKSSIYKTKLAERGA